MTQRTEIAIVFDQFMLSRIDRWIKEQRDKPSRNEAVARLVNETLTLIEVNGKIRSVC